jgi:hypothetical protein
LLDFGTNKWTEGKDFLEDHVRFAGFFYIAETVRASFDQFASTHKLFAIISTGSETINEIDELQLVTERWLLCVVIRP